MKIQRVDPEKVLPFTEMVANSRIAGAMINLRIAHSAGLVEDGVVFQIREDGTVKTGMSIKIEDAVTIAAELLRRYAPEKLA